MDSQTAIDKAKEFLPPGTRFKYIEWELQGKKQLGWIYNADPDLLRKSYLIEEHIA